MLPRYYSREIKRTGTYARSFQFLQLLESCQNDVFTCFFDLTRQEHFIQNSIHFVKVEHEVQLTYIVKEGVKDLDKQMDGFQICEFVVVGVHAYTKEETSVTSIHYLVIPKLYEVGLVFLVTRSNQSVNLSSKSDLLVVIVGNVPFRKTSFALTVL